jgi:hypothetical protein
MATLQIDSDLPDMTMAQSLAGWRRECCVELLGDGAARIFVRAVEESSFKAAELHRAILFHRLDPRFTDLRGCIEAARPEFERLVDGARRCHPDKENLFVTVQYEHSAWERVRYGLDRWVRR